MEKRETYEVWVQRDDGQWGRARDKESGLDLWGEKKRALAVAAQVAQGESVVQAVVIERRPIFYTNGAGKLKRILPEDLEEEA